MSNDKTCIACKLHRALAIRVWHVMMGDVSGYGRSRANSARSELLPSSSSGDAQALAILGRGKDGTLVYPATQIPSRFAPDACVIVERAQPLQSQRRRGCINASDSVALQRAGLVSDVALKDIRDEASAKAEAVIHAHLRTCFRGSRKMQLCCLHPRVESVSVDGHLLLPMRVGSPIDISTHRPSSAHRQSGIRTASDLLALSRGVLGALTVMHANRVLHLDVKPQNVMLNAAASAASTTFVLVDYDLTAHFDDVLDAMRDGPVPVGTPGYISPLLLGRMEPAYVRCCLAASSDKSREVCARFGVHVPRFSDAGWLERFALLRHRVLSSSSAAAALLPQIDLHSLAVTLHRLRAAHQLLEVGDKADGDRLTAVIGGLISGAFDDAAGAIKVCGRSYSKA